MKFKLLYIIFLSSIFNAPLAQNLPDSLKEVKHGGQGYYQINKLNKLSEKYYNEYPELALELAVQAEKLSRTRNNPIGLASALFNKAVASYHLTRYDTATTLANKALEHYKTLQDSLGISKIYRLYGNLAHSKGKHDSARMYYNKSLKIKKTHKDYRGRIYIYNNLAVSYQTEGDFLKALQYLNNAIQLADSIDKPSLKAVPLANITETYLKLGDYEKAIDYGFQVLQLTNEYNLTTTRATACSALGSAYKAINNYDKAMEFYAKSLNAAKNQENIADKAQAYKNIATVLQKQNEHTKATNHLKKALSLFNQLNDNNGKASVLNYLAVSYNQLGITNRALIFVNKAIAINQKAGASFNLAQNHHVKGQILINKNKFRQARQQLLKSLELLNEQQIEDKKDVLMTLAGLHEKTGDHARANNYLKKYIENIRELSETRRNKTIQALKVQNELEEHIKEKELLEKEARLHEIELKRQNQLRNVLAGGIILLVILIITLLTLHRQRLKSIRQLKERNRRIRQQTMRLTMVDKELRKFRFILDNADNAVIITSPDGNIEWINKSLTRTYGFSLDEFIRIKGSNIKTKSGRKDLQKILDQVFRTGNSLSYEAINTAKDGSLIYTHTTVTPVKNEKGEITNLVFIDSDITEQKNIEQELKKTIRTRDKFLSIIAHDLRNPFHAIIGFSKLMIAKYNTMSENKKYAYIKNIQLASNQGYDLLNNLLSWAKNQSGDINYSPESVSVKELVERNISSLTFRAEEKNISLHSQVNTDQKVWADYNMTDTIIRNLLSNAIKFTPEDGQVTIKTLPKDDFMQINIEDTGLGIDKEASAKIFQDINYTTKGTNNEGGTGLGLVLCKEFTNKNQGEIWVESQPGSGSVFSFTLPLEHQHHVSETPNQ